ncbi:MAG: transporter substrate-binding domain-containing protein [Clostridiales bacterium]|jgi:signal transduction histidine kinase/CheY-like chemotaxis protein|nr:transporter substrate-binding domain-containing protein [Clostridiales bacterium]
MKRFFACAIVICLLFAPVLALNTGASNSAAGAAPEHISQRINITTYKDIPGITEEEISAVEALKQTCGSFTYGHTLQSEAYMLSDGSFRGFVYSFCEHLSSIFETQFTPVYYTTWSEIMRDFDAQKLDFLGDLTSTDERREIYCMSRTIAERSISIHHLDSRREITREADLEGLRIGTFAGTITADEIKSSYQISFEAVPGSSTEDLVNMLYNGEVDAIIAETVGDPDFSPYKGIKSHEMFSLIYNPVSMSTARAELAPIISVVDKYLLAGGIDTLYEMYEQTDYEYAKFKLQSSLTAEEDQYINHLKTTGKKINLALEQDNYPISFFNRNEGDFQGIAKDVLWEIAGLLDVEFSIKTTEDTTWAEIMEKLRSGEISVVSQLLYSDARAGQFLWSNEAYASSNYALISKESFPDLKIFQVNRTRVGTIAQTGYEDMYYDWFPDDTDSISYETHNTALDALERGEIDLLMASGHILLTQLNYREKPGYKINVDFNWPGDSLFGYNKNEAILASVIDKAQEYIDTAEIASKWESRTFDYSLKFASQQALFLIMVIFVLLAATLIFFTMYNRTNNLSRELARQTEEAKIASEAKGAFLARMSHEIRTPLNAVIGMSLLAKNSITNTEKASSYIEQIIASSKHLMGILNDVLDMSKIESGKLTLINEPFREMDAFMEVVGMITNRCDEKEIRFISDANNLKDLIVIGDKLRLNQVLINLLSNAVKFTGKGGEITLRGETTRESETDVTITFSVTDTGIGMTQEQMKNLFVPFEQANAKIAQLYGGTGLGLSISQTYIKMLGGEIKAESEPGKGTKFHFTVTMQKGKMPEYEPPEGVCAASFPGKRLLLAEDVEVNRFLMTELLSPCEIETTEAVNGEEAVSIFEKSPEGYFHLILMDIQMPVMDGYEATKAIRNLKRADAEKIPIVAMTANAYKEDIEAAKDAGMNSHLAKPIDTDKLFNTLTEFLADNNTKGGGNFER